MAKNKESATPNVRRLEEKQWMEVLLTEDEIRDEAKSLADALNKKREAEERLDAFKAQVKGEITELEGRINRAAALVNAGKEHRQVEVEVQLDFNLGMRIEIRKDTGEEFRRRPLTTDERQMELEV